MTEPYIRGAAITTSDTVDIATGMTDAIYVGGAGVVQVVFENGAVVPMTAVVGGLLAVRARRVRATGTTATLLVGLYRT